MNTKKRLMTVSHDPRAHDQYFSTRLGTLEPKREHVRSDTFALPVFACEERSNNFSILLSHSQEAFPFVSDILSCD